MTPTVLVPLFDDDAAEQMLALWHGYGSYGQYSNEGFDTGFAPELAQRYDASANFVRTGGRFGRREDRRLLAARTNYFRETYSYGEHACSPGVEAFRDDPGLLAAAAHLHDRPVTVPAIVYANIATAVAYFGDAEGDDRWTVRAGDAADAADGPVAEYRTSDLRYSVSWKAYCFADETERDAWAAHHDDLTLDHILDTLETDLRSRGHLDGPRPPAPDFGKLLIDTYIHFPATAPAPA